MRKFSSAASFVDTQRGVFLLEALIAILIFAMGILGIVALGATAINAQSDAQYRSEAAALASEIVGKIEAAADRTTGTSLAASVGAYAHQPSGAITSCAFGGGASSNADVTDWVSRVSTTTSSSGLPGSASTMQQILVTALTPTVQQVTVTICWQAPKDGFARRHTFVGYVSSASANLP
jgi:type IV pilus assembly protein PilV